MIRDAKIKKKYYCDSEHYVKTEFVSGIFAIICVVQLKYKQNRKHSNVLTKISIMTSANSKTLIVILLLCCLFSAIFAYARVDNYPQRRPNATVTHFASVGGGRFNQTIPNNSNNWPRNNYAGGGNQFQGQQQPTQNNWPNAPQAPTLNNPWLRANQTNFYPPNTPTGFNNHNATAWGSSGFGQNGWKNPQQYPGSPPTSFVTNNTYNQQNPSWSANAPLAPSGGGFTSWNSSGTAQRPAVGTNPYAHLFY